MKHNTVIVVLFFIIICIFCGCLAASGEFQVKYDYWDNGKPRQAKYLDAQENLRAVKYFREDGTLEQFVAYNDNGDITEESYFGEDGKLCQNPVDNWAAKKAVYEAGALREMSYYGADGKITERDLYSPGGSVADRQFFGNSRVGDRESFKTDLQQFSSPEQEIDSRIRVGTEINEYYNKNGDLKDQTVTVR